MAKGRSHMSEKTLQNKRPIAVLMLLTTAVLWSLAGILIKYIDWNPLAIVGARSIIASLVIYPVFIHKKKLKLTKPMVMGAIAYCVTLVTFVSANKLTTAANSILLQYTAPIYVAVFSYWLLKEKIFAIDWITIALIIAGMALFFLDDLTTGNMLGNVLAIISGMAFAFMAIFLRKQKDASPIQTIFIGNILTGIVGLPFMFSSFPNTNGLVALLFLGVVQLAIPYILFALAIKHVSALESLLIPIIEPILNPIWVFIFLKESPGKWAFIGGAVVLVSILTRGYVIYLKSTKNKRMHTV